MSSFNRAVFFVFVLVIFYTVNLKADSLTVLMAGDVMLGSWGIEEIEKNGLDYPIKNLHSEFLNADVNMCQIRRPKVVPPFI